MYNITLDYARSYHYYHPSSHRKRNITTSSTAAGDKQTTSSTTITDSSDAKLTAKGGGDKLGENEKSDQKSKSSAKLRNKIQQLKILRLEKCTILNFKKINYNKSRQWVGSRGRGSSVRKFYVNTNLTNPLTLPSNTQKDQSVVSTKSTFIEEPFKNMNIRNLGGAPAGGRPKKKKVFTGTSFHQQNKPKI